MTVDDSIDALNAAFAAAGVEPPSEPPADELARLDEIEAIVEPLRLPGDVRRMWERLDAHSAKAWTYPRLTRASFALDSWLEHRETFPGIAPAALLMVGYESWACMSVELAGPHGDGGALFEWRLDGPDFQPRYESVCEWIDRLTALLTSGTYERREVATGAYLLVKDEETALPLNTLGRALKTHPLLLGLTEISGGPQHWPHHWQRSSGIELRDLRAHGATHTIAEVLGSDPTRALAATIAGRVASLHGRGEGTTVTVDDGTGTITVFCRSAITAPGPVAREQFEFDITVQPGARDAARTNHALAVATAIRPAKS